jgi:sortase (surface protein transpeptidase)
MKLPPRNPWRRRTSFLDRNGHRAERATGKFFRHARRSKVGDGRHLHTSLSYFIQKITKIVVVGGAHGF